MKIQKFNIFMILLLVCIVGVYASKLFAETLTLSSAIPSPVGIYDKIRLVPRKSLDNDPHCNDSHDLGMLYYDDGLNDKMSGMYICVMVDRDEFDWRVFVLGESVDKNE